MIVGVVFTQEQALADWGAGDGTAATAEAGKALTGMLTRHVGAALPQ